MDMNTDGKDARKSRGRKRAALIVLLLLLLFLGVGTACFGLGTVLVRDDDATGGVAVTLDPLAHLIGADSDDQSGSSGIVIPGWDEIDVAAGSTTAQVDFFNPEENAGSYYLSFEVRIAGDGDGEEVLYSSGLVEPGRCISEIELSHALAKGSYEATVHVQPYRYDDGLTPTNNADVKTTIVVA